MLHYIVMFVMTFPAMLLDISNELTSTKQYCFALVFWQTLMGRRKFTHSLKCSYQVLHKCRSWLFHRL